MTKEEGFTLLEVLVALAILVLGLAAIFSSFETGISATTTSASEQALAAGAENFFAEVDQTRPFQPGTTTGELPGEIRWTCRIALLETPGDGNAPPVLAVYSVQLDLREVGASKSASRFQTLVLRPVP